MRTWGLPLVLSLPFAFLLSGCSTGTVPNTTALNTLTAPAARAPHGAAHGGQQPINGAAVNVYEVGSSGYGSAPTLLYSTSTSPSDGSFNFPIASWSANCTASGTNSAIPVYLTVSGGDSGSGPNSAILLMAALGGCNTITASTFVYVDEVTTVASAYALAHFTNASNGNIGAYLSSPTGLINAFATYNNLVNTTTGLALTSTPAGNGVVPASEINSLANILASCVNSGNGSTGCSSLFAAAMPSGGSAPNNTLQVALDIALNPANNVSALFGLSTANAPFQAPLPLTSAPNDWTVALSFSGGGLHAPYGIAIDGSGNVWVTNAQGASISKFSSAGAAISPATTGFIGGGLNGPLGIAIDGSGNAWVTNYSGGSISEFDSSGTANALSPFIGGGLGQPISIAIDGSGNVWVANYQNSSISKFSSAGTAISSSGGYTGGGLSGPYGIAVDGSGNIWVGNNTSSRISEFNSSGAANNLSPFSGGGLSGPFGIAADGSGNLWAANSNASISELNSSGTAVSGSSGYTGGGVNRPYATAIDGSGNVWTANYTGNSLSKFNSSGVAISVSSGYTGGGLFQPEGIAIDGSGNVWATDPSGSISELVGAATPVITPIVGGLAGNPTVNGSSSLGTAPGPAFQVSGQINTNTGCSNTTVSGATVSINTIPVQTTTTDSSGSFSFQNVPNGTYTLTPSIVGPSSVFSPATQTVTVSGGNPVNTNFGAILGYTVSGTATYGGSQTGPIYLALNSTNCGGGGTFGTEISAAGAYTIRGVPPGTYTLQAFRDNLGYGAPNASNAAGSGTTGGVVVSTANVGSANVTLTDPGSVTLSSGPDLQSVIGFNNGAAIQFKPLKNSNSVETATSYTLQWSTDQTFATGVSSQTFPAIGTKGGPAFVNGIANGSGYYFRIYGTSGGTPVGPYSSVSGPVTIGAPTGGNTVTGSVSFTGAATGPLYVGFFDQDSGNIYGEYIPSPASAQAYTIQVPNGSNYFLFAAVDQNNDGVIDRGDINNVGQGNDNGSGIAINAPTSNENVTLPSGTSTASVTTQNYKSTNSGGTVQSYDLSFRIDGVIKQPIAVTLISGPNTISPVDIALCTNQNSCGQGFQINFNIGSTSPTVGDTYTFAVTYSDGTNDTVMASVSAVLTGFPTSLAPTTGGSVSTTPTFTWTDPANASNYSYSFQIQDSSGNTVWQIPGNNSNSNGFSSSTTSIVWGTDPTGGGSTPSPSNLSTSTVYAWQIQLSDSNGNEATQQVFYQP